MKYFCLCLLDYSHKILFFGVAGEDPEPKDKDSRIQFWMQVSTRCDGQKCSKCETTAEH